MSLRVVLSAVVTASGAFTAASLACAQPRAHPVADAMRYGELVEKYVHDDGSNALREILTWEPDVIAAAIDKVEDAGWGASVRIKAVRAAFPAAVMLHTEAALYLNGQEDSLGAGRQWGHARRLAELPPRTREQNAFLRAWYHAVGLFCLGSYGIDNAILFLERGLQRFPDDAPLALALGQAYEARGTFREGRIPSMQSNLTPEARRDLRTAEGLYRDLLRRDPLLWEARLRLGRCLWLGGRDEVSLSELQRTGSNSDLAHLRYLAHLFTGDQFRRESRLPEARQEFAQAVEAWPGGQAAAVSLAETLHALGERTEAASALEAAIAERGDTKGADPFRSYQVGDRAEHKRLLEAVREMARAPHAK